MSFDTPAITFSVCCAGEWWNLGPYKVFAPSMMIDPALMRYSSPCALSISDQYLAAVSGTLIWSSRLDMWELSNIIAPVTEGRQRHN